MHIIGGVSRERMLVLHLGRFFLQSYLSYNYLSSRCGGRPDADCDERKVSTINCKKQKQTFITN